jgi:hypothetical protein
MIGHDNRDLRYPELVYGPAQLSDRLRLVKKILCGDAAHRENQARTNKFDLSLQMGGASEDFLRPGVPVSRRTTFQNVRDIDITARQADGPQHLIQQETRPADKRFALAVFIRTGRLAYDHPLCGSIPNPENRLSPGLMQLTLSASGHLSFQPVPYRTDILSRGILIRIIPIRIIGSLVDASGYPDRNIHGAQNTMLISAQEMTHSDMAL